MIGISDGAVLQRGKDGTCDIYLIGQMQRLSYEGAACGEAALSSAENGRIRVTGIPTGGPYTVRLDDQVLHDIYVGDIWILAGQSNMEGNGIYRESDRIQLSDSMVRAFYMTGQWGTAAHPLHTPWKAVDRIHRELSGLDESGSSYRGVGPGLMFAQQMKRITGVPQGLLCCAHGGTTLEQWSPALADEGENSLLGSLLKTVERCGGRAAGLFWYQGCSEAMSGYGKPVEEFSERTLALFSADAGSARLRAPDRAGPNLKDGKLLYGGFGSLLYNGPGAAAEDENTDTASCRYPDRHGGTGRFGPSFGRCTGQRRIPCG